ncbi:uncharacterized protein SAPINGB_P002466 [Magnusiomyces paraingens]|uniref:Uncharacterized protein n=1 Tax=Magnusiomyces paraingens TaxID=2606893 RepID=A0A5E8BE32_9ASCO|nr:uncharacterized protein SAPINGB_P002466 [Saprochaete ingens]VVT49833.1 unnamed protein product [Saprochaete ingens]
MFDQLRRNIVEDDIMDDGVKRGGEVFEGFISSWIDSTSFDIKMDTIIHSFEDPKNFGSPDMIVERKLSTIVSHPNSRALSTALVCDNIACSTGSSVAHSTSETHSKNNASSYETFADLPVHRQIDLADRSGFTVRQLTIANVPVCSEGCEAELKVLADLTAYIRNSNFKASPPPSQKCCRRLVQLIMHIFKEAANESSKTSPASLDTVVHDVILNNISPELIEHVNDLMAIRGRDLWLYLHQEL